MLSDKCLSFRLELVDEFPKIVPSAFVPFIGHHQGLLACVRCVYIFFKYMYIHVYMQGVINKLLSKLRKHGNNKNNLFIWYIYQNYKKISWKTED